MGSRGAAPFALLLALLLPAPAAADTALPPSPHSSISDPLGCNRCHKYYTGALDPHEFVVAIPPVCWKCHPSERLGRSHPIGVDPRDSKIEIEVPDDLPLEDGKVSCGSCHQPHRDHLSKVMAFTDQPVKFRQEVGRKEVKWFSTIFLRKSDPKLSFEPLCLACHKDF